MLVHHCGFTSGAVDVAPWLSVNPNYTDINVEQALNDPESIFYYYQKLVQLRREMPIIVHGKYDILHEENTHIFMYKRYNDEGQELIIACNFSQQPIKIDDTQLSQRLNNHKKLLISNYEKDKKTDWLDFRSYEAWALEIS
jgi:oligo-1,6-glucosidase